MAAGGAICTARQVSAADNTNTNNAATSSTASAETSSDSGSTFADKLSQKLGVDKSKVQTALTDIKKECQDERKAKLSANLDQAVKDGVITADQKQKILDRQAQMKTQRDQQRADDKQWAKDNGIDMSKLRPYLGGKWHRGAKKN